MSKLKVARGRGNQGDWASPYFGHGEKPEHRDHNAEVDRKKAEKQAKKNIAKAAP